MLNNLNPAFNMIGISVHYCKLSETGSSRPAWSRAGEQTSGYPFSSCSENLKLLAPAAEEPATEGPATEEFVLKPE